MTQTPPTHRETHRTDQVGWLRAAVLGANDGVVSVASVVVGVAAGSGSASAVLLAGTAATIAGAVSMAAGEYVSVQSQADAEGADLAKERRELRDDPDGELAELTAIFQQRGLSESLAREVAVALTARDALAAHAREELGITEALQARPIQAAFSSAGAFTVGAILPLIAAVLAPADALSMVVTAVTLVTLLLLGAAAAWVGGASIVRGALRVFTWGTLAMALTAAVGALVGQAGI